VPTATAITTGTKTAETRSTCIDGGAGDLVAGPDLDRDALPGQQRPVDGRAALDDDTVGRDLLAGTHDEQVAFDELLDRHAPLRPVRIEDCRLLRPELGERTERGACPSLGASLEIPSGEQERDDDRRDLEIDLVAPSGLRRREVERHLHPGDTGVEEEERDDRPAPGGERAEGDQRVHRRGRMAEVLPRGDVKRPGPPEDDRRRELEREPLPVPELERRNHPHEQNRQRQHGRDDQPAAERSRRIVLRGGSNLRLRQARGVADLLDGIDKRVGRHARGIELDGRLLRRVVHRRGDAFELVQLPLDARRARGACHALDRQIDTARQLDAVGRNRHRCTSTVKGAVCTTLPILNWRKTR
jgi:hypothetical protein